MKALILDDHADEAELIARELQRAGLQVDWRQAANREEFEQLLGWSPDVVLADYVLPDFSAPEALEILSASALDAPFIVISGSIGDETAVKLMKLGATDYLPKDRLARVGIVVNRALEERHQRLAVADSERRLYESEERMRFALEAAKVGTWEADLQSGESRWSPVLEVLHGLAPGTFGGTFQAFLEQIIPADREAVTRALETATRDHTDANIEYRNVWPDGSLHWIRGRGRTFYDERGVPLRAAGVGYDVTELHALEHRYRQSQKMEAVGQLAGGVAHDFNNLLTIIKGFTNLILEQPGHPDERELEQILIATDRATSLTRQLLAFSRRQIFELSVFDLRELVQRLVPMMQRLIGETIEVIVHASAQRCDVKADVAQIEQVILNLAVNARDAMESGGHLAFDVSRASIAEPSAERQVPLRPGEYVRLSVSDSGSGMEPALLEHIFEPFFTTKAKEKGTGLGLSTVYGIVSQSGGHISVYSEPGLGSTFTIYLPLSDGATLPEAPPPAAIPDAGRGDETILVVEDDEGIRLLVSDLLGRRGYRVLVAPTPHEAIRIASEMSQHVDLLLTDVVLPEMSGKALAERLTKTRPTLRVLYMSGYTGDVIMFHGALDAGANFIQKPFAPDQLIGKIREVFERP